MIIDTHIHTSEFSRDSSLPVESAVLKARETGLDGICITDHESMGILDLADDLTRQYGLLVIPGVEILTDLGDIIVFGTSDIPFRNVKARELIRRVSEQGGITVSAHPFRDNGRGMGNNIINTPGLSAIEVMNGRTRSIHNSMAYSLAAEMGLPSLGGSDAHTIEEVGRYATFFMDEITSVNDFIRSIKSGRTSPVARYGTEFTHVSANPVYLRPATPYRTMDLQPQV